MNRPGSCSFPLNITGKQIFEAAVWYVTVFGGALGKMQVFRE